MPAGLKSRIQDDIKTAMRARDRERLGALRQITAAIKQREVDDRVELGDQDVLAVLDKMLKQRRDALGQFQDAGRTDLADQESFEIRIIEQYMPAALSEAEVAAEIDAVLSETGASNMRDMGKVMGQLKGKLQGRADLAAVSALVKARLSGG